MGGDGRKGGGPGPATPKNGPKAPTAPAAPGSPSSPGGGGGGGGKPSQPGNASPGGVKNPQGGGKKGGGGDTTPEAAPQKWYDALRRKKSNRRDTYADMYNDAQVINPRFWENDPADPSAWTTNCTRTSATFEMRARGYDVTAGSRRSNKSDMDISDITEKWVDPKTGDHRDFSWARVTGNIVKPDGTILSEREEFQRRLENGIRRGGEGSRGFVRVNWANQGIGHIFNYEIRNGEIWYIEPQDNPSPNAKKWGGWFKGTDWMDRVDFDSDYNGIMRTDDLEPTKLLVDKGWIYQRTYVEVNAPLFSEMVWELDRRYPGGTFEDSLLRSAFRAGWQKVRTNTSPDQMPDSVPSSSPEMVQAYKDGLEWARRPD